MYRTAEKIARSDKNSLSCTSQKLFSFFDSYLRAAVNYFCFSILFACVAVQLMEITNYIGGKLVPELLRQKIIYIDGADDTEFINIDSVDVNELNEAFALTKPYAVDVKLSRYAERDVKHEFHLVVKVSNIIYTFFFCVFGYLFVDVASIFFSLHIHNDTRNEK